MRKDESFAVFEMQGWTRWHWNYKNVLQLAVEVFADKVGVVTTILSIDINQEIILGKVSNVG